MKTQWLKTFFIVTCFCSGMASASSLKETAVQYFEVYKERKDFQALLSFYDESAQLEDLVYGFFAKDKATIKAFFNWDDGKFRVLDNGDALILENLVVDNNIAVAEGIFRPFNYDGKDMGPWRFMTWLEFNEQQKIIRHVDWINYTPRENFLGGANLNPSSTPSP